MLDLQNAHGEPGYHAEMLVETLLHYFLSEVSLSMLVTDLSFLMLMIILTQKLSLSSKVLISWTFRSFSKAV